MLDPVKCPKCDPPAELESVVVHEVEVDRCSSCGGIWFDRSELGRLIELEEQDLAPLLAGKPNEGANQRHGACPREGQELIRVGAARSRDVIVDFCWKCQGVWLDAGELERLRNAPPKS
tara:strand:+ start:704 stop:1060 length:357 start_codon:yes stop_codon:yes gene_type:complete